MYFNPRPRKEGDVNKLIHDKEVILISIHALVKRATVSQRCFEIWQGYFNPRPRKEGDVLGASNIDMLRYISIHALVKRATFDAYIDKYAEIFQSTPS